MANGNSKMLTAEQKMQLRQPIDDYVGKIQRQIDDLREDGTEKVVSIQNTIDGIKRNRALSKAEKDSSIAKAQAELEKAKAVEAKNKDEISKLISQAESYLLPANQRKQCAGESCGKRKIQQENCAVRERASGDRLKAYGSSGNQR